MSISKMTVLLRALAIGALAVGIVAKSPMSEHELTETSPPQEIGSMTSDGFLIYSMNHCVVTQTTNCEVSLSTGPPAVEPTDQAPSSGAVGSGTTISKVPGGDPYPVPTGEPGVSVEPTAGEETEGGQSTGGNDSDNTATLTDATITSSGTADSTSTESGDETTPTEGDDDPSGTGTAATGTATAGGSITHVFEARVLGVVGLLSAAYLM